MNKCVDGTIQGTGMILIWWLILCVLSCGITMSDEDFIPDAEAHAERIESVLVTVRLLEI